MFDKIKQFMEMKKQAEQIKRELDGLTLESQEINGIKIIIDGSMNLKSIEIDQHFLQAEGKDKLEADIVRSVNAAVKKSQNLAAQKMKEFLPGLPGF